MTTGWRYRALSISGVCSLTIIAVLAANHPIAQEPFTTYVPVFNRLDATIRTGRSLHETIAVSVCVTVLALLPMYKPRPRRILDAVMLSQKRVVTAGFALACLGYFEWSSRLPRATLVMTVGVLLATVPAWFVVIRRPRTREMKRTVVVGDDLPQIRSVMAAVDGEVVGFLCPTSALPAPEPDAVPTDGGVVAADDRLHLGGLSRLEDVLVERDVDTAVLAFGEADRGEFFGALDACHEHGVDAKVHREYADAVLTPTTSVGELVDVEIEPWDWQDYALKRLFDVAFATVGLAAWAPVMLAIALSIKLDSPGPVLYEQERTAVLGETFSIYKFRSMVEDAEDETGATLSEDDAGDVDPRVTTIGRVLRPTHLDELPQLWSVLRGDMSVVGPRPERPELDHDIESGGVDWRKRWFVKPGLTGLAQIRDVTGHQPREKLRLDLEYIRNQSTTYDVKIVVRQLWQVLGDAVKLLR